MKVLVFTSGDGPEMREAKQFAVSLADAGYDIQYLEAEEEETPAVQELYDIYSYPSFVVIQNDGTFVERWRGITPLDSDIKMFLG